MAGMSKLPKIETSDNQIGATLQQAAQAAMPLIAQAIQPQQPVTSMPNPMLPQDTAQPSIVDQAVAKYPILKALNPVGLMSTDTPDGDNMLEHWSPNEQGDTERPRPKELPLNRLGIQIFSNKTTPDDVAADIVSHTLVNTDPNIKGAYQQFKGSLTPQQKEFLRGDYEEERKTSTDKKAIPSFDKWLDKVGTPAALRGYIFNQYKPQDQKEFGYSDRQKMLLDSIKGYITQ
jgi:hypothetical protein